MAEIIKKSLNILDYLIIMAAFWVFSHIDFANLSWSNIFYLVTFVLWFGMLAVRIFIMYRNERQK